jgi:hypothetical protein
MTDKPRLIILASVATLALALAQPVRAEGEQAPAATPTPTPEAAPATPAPEAAAAASAPAGAPANTAHADSRQRMEAHMAEMTAERNRRYGELRQRASEVGIELPETPPWEQAMPEMPKMPDMPQMPAMPKMPDMAGMQGMTGEEREAMRAAHYQAMRERAKAAGIDLPETPPAKLMTPEERRAHWDSMRNQTPEERQAGRAETYKQLRERAKAQGIDLPETPPWEQAQQRRKAMQEKWEAYRKQVDAMTEEQREAARAIFSGGPGDQAPPMPMERPMPQMPMRQMPQMPMDMPNQGLRGFGPGPCPMDDCDGMGMPRRGMMPGWGGNQGLDQPQGGFPEGGYPQAPWGRGY